MNIIELMQAVSENSPQALESIIKDWPDDVPIDLEGMKKIAKKYIEHLNPEAIKKAKYMMTITDKFWNEWIEQYIINDDKAAHYHHRYLSGHIISQTIAIMLRSGDSNENLIAIFKEMISTIERHITILEE